MKKALFVFIVSVIFVGALLVVVYFNTAPTEPEQPITSDFKNATYTMVDGTSVTLIDGVAEKVLDNDLATKIIIRYLGNELYTDLNEDGREDVVFLITEDRGGSGAFFYVVAALNTEAGYIGSDAVLLGDRIAPPND